jgi:hypothetical protein
MDECRGHRDEVRREGSTSGAGWQGGSDLICVRCDARRTMANPTRLAAAIYSGNSRFCAIPNTWEA